MGRGGGLSGGDVSDFSCSNLGLRLRGGEEVDSEDEGEQRRSVVYRSTLTSAHCLVSTTFQ